MAVLLVPWVLTVSACAEDPNAADVISVNAATYWMSLRWLGISDEISGFGKLLTLPLPEGARLQA